jgi:hypothetical protein
VACLPKSFGLRNEGEPCADASDCTSGLGCTRRRICARYCASDADCHGAGKCVKAKDEGSKGPVPGSGTCTRWCDPLTGANCKPGSGCYGVDAAIEDPNASCANLYSSKLKKRGEPCQSYNECEVPLVCADYGPRVCVASCYSDADCREPTGHCYLDFLVPIAGADQRPLGQCVASSCNASSLPEPPVWSDGPVWNKEETIDCITRCAETSDECFELNCKNGRRWRYCMDSVLDACAGGTGKACHAEYASMTCSDINARPPLRIIFNTCAESQPNCRRLAERSCAVAP